jgi:DNA-binding SARP family transcriptional activator
MLLGPVDVAGSAGASQLLSQPKSLTLLAFLALQTRHGHVSRERLLGLFWPDQPEDKARASLRTALHNLRDALGADIIARRGDTDVSLDHSAMWCDALEFDAAVKDDALARALELYRGPLMDGLFPGTAALEHWLDEEREHYRAAAADAAWKLAERYESASKDLTSAARWARKAAKLSRADERRIRRVMSLLDRAGDTAGAMAVYEEFARDLKRDLEMEPSEETQALARTLKRGERKEE